MLRRFSLAILTLSFACAPALASVAVSETSSQTELERELKKIEQQITGYQKQVTTLRGQKNSLANKIAQLKAEQEQTAAEIRMTSLRLKAIAVDIQKTHEAVKESFLRAEKTKRALGGIIRNIHRLDNVSLVESVLSNASISAAADDIVASEQVNDRLFDVLVLLRKTDDVLHDQAAKLDDQEADQQKYAALQVLQAQKLQSSIGEQRDLLAVTRGKETQYQVMLGESQKQAAAIKNRIYELLAAERVTFGQAVAIAQWVSRQTGVRASFLLAVLTQESNLGKNVGTCNRKGDPASKGWRVIMKPDRDHQPFLTITRELGRDPEVTPVSCPMRDAAGNQVGYGGAMGPAQFIPSTWMGYRAKVAAMTGKSADPWDIRDAFTAAGIKLKADGAGTVSGEWTAAMKYFSGSTNTRFRFYGDNVVATAEKYQKDIESLQ